PVAAAARSASPAAGQEGTAEGEPALPVARSTTSLAEQAPLASAKRLDAGEGEDDHGPVGEEDSGQRVERGLGGGPPAGAADVVVDDQAQAVDPVGEGQSEQRPVEDAPAQVVPSMGDERVVRVHHVVEDVSDGEVDEGQEH